MERKTMKRALSLFLAFLMIALAVPFTMLSAFAVEDETIPAEIKNAKMFATYSDGYDLHVKYGSVEGMIDGDPYGAKSSNEQYPYFYSDPWAYCNTELYISSIGQTRTYYGYALFELNGLSKLSDVTVWLAGDGISGTTNHWINQLKWNMVDAYDILVSTEGETWTLMSEVTGLHTQFPSANTTRAEKTSTGDGSYKIYGNKVAFGNAAEAKYVAVAVKECINETGTQIVIGELTVTGLVSSESTEKTPAEIYAEAKDGDLLKAINFNEAYWSDDYFNSNSWNTYYIVTDNGNAVKQSIHTKELFGANKKRAIWGGLIADERFPIVNDSADSDNCYTVYFDLKFGNDNENVGFGIQVDGSNSLVIDGAGNSYWYNWTTQRVGAPTDPNKMWTNKTGRDKTDKQTFAIEIDANTEEMILYVEDSDGLLNKVRTLTYEADPDGAYDGINYNLTCGIYVVSIDGKVLDRSTEISNLRIYKGFTNSVVLNVDGASVRIDNPTGIRFRSQFGKGLIDSLRTTYGEENVNIGMIITPTDYLTGNDVEFEMAALDECSAITGAKYVKITATAIHENELFYVINCALVNVHTENYNRKFSARAFIEVNGEVYKYAEFDMEDNSRSIAYVAERAYNDAKATQDSVYSNAIKLDVGTTAYSPYTTEGRNTLKGFFNENTSATLTVMTYNIRAYGDADSFWDSITGNYEGWAGRDPKLTLETITEFMPDVVGLQEDDKNLYNEYSKVAGLSNYARITDSGNGNEGNEILYKKNAGISLVKSGVVYYKELAKSYSDNENVAAADFSLDTKGENSVGRFFRWAILEKDGVKFLVVNTHLHYKASGTESASDAVNKDLRKAQATLIRLWLAGMASECANQIVMGDMNAQEDSKEMKGGFLEGTGALSLAENNAVRLGDTDGTLVNEGFVERQPWAYDHIFFSANTLKTLEFSVVDNIDVGANTNYPSDHVPVVAKFIAK